MPVAFQPTLLTTRISTKTGIPTSQHHLHNDTSRWESLGWVSTGVAPVPKKTQTRNAWQSLAYSPLSATVSPPSR